MAGRAVLIEVYLLRCEADGTLAFRRLAGYLAGEETPDAAAWRIGLAAPLAGARHPAEPAVAVHSTSWRPLDDGTIVLSYVVAPDPEPGLAAIPVPATGLARSGDARRPSPPRIAHEQVAAHAARHLALVTDTDPAVRAVVDQSPRLARALAPLTRAPAGRPAD